LQTNSSSKTLLAASTRSWRPSSLGLPSDCLIPPPGPPASLSESELKSTGSTCHVVLRSLGGLLCNHDITSTIIINNNKFCFFYHLLETYNTYNCPKHSSILNIYIYLSDGSRLEAPKVANGIEPTLAGSSTHNIPAPISPRPRGPDRCNNLDRSIIRQTSYH